ncbi:FAD-binding oxidoreductase [Kaustia mangrovi]|uniref:FAD-binding oxidoreductase n=1 Tax=Kaustia mangrovi TaxID=2593653 RepID=A0A7S8C614_9HYPH|nr:FAD-binding oxidoreductase [Kaustia mangrovi]QPC44051.1 FAD-binding oxidoreductase [Kaustia mangrovi]
MRDTDVFSTAVSFEPYWWEAAPRPEPRTENLPANVDMAIVGSGFAGLSAALTAARHGLSVLVLEAEALGQGASTRNGGAVGDTLRISFSAMEARFGQDAAVNYYLGVREARQHLERLIAQHGIACHYRKAGRFIGAHKPADYEAMARDLERRRAAIGFEAEMVPAGEVRSAIGSDAFAGGRIIHTDGNLHPGLFHQGLADAAKAAGATIADRTRVTGFDRAGSGFAVATERGPVRADRLIVATNGYTGRLSAWLARRLIPIQSQIIATEPLGKDLAERLVPAGRQMGDTRKLHNYWRLSPDGTRLLFGGRAGASELRDRRRAALMLREQMLSIYPELRDVAITHAWAGFIAYTFDALPHMASHDGIHYVGGCCGSGVAMQPYLGHKAALKALGSPEAATPFDRIHPTFPGYGGNPWFMPAVIAYFGLRDRLKR